MVLKQKLDLTKLFFGGMFILLGVVALLVMLHQHTEWNEFKKTAQPASATITEIRVTHSGTGKKRKTHRKVYISYNVDGKEYNGKLGYYTAGMYEGQVVDILYDPENPEKHMSDPLVMNIILLLMGCIFALIGAGFGLTEIKHYLRVKKVIDENKYVLCDDWQLLPASQNSRSERYYYVKCKYTDTDGTNYVFNSSSFHPNLNPFEDGQPIKVYVDLFELGGSGYYFVSDEKTTGKTL